jgi:O-antigen ligase
MSTASLPVAPNHSSDWQKRALGLILLLEILALTLPGVWWQYFGISLLTLALLFALVRSVVYRRATGLILGWMLIFPLGYYYASFPKEQPVLTLDRVFIGTLLVAACFAGLYKNSGNLRELRKPAIWWAIFLTIAATTIPRTKSPMGGLRILLDGFVLPAILASFVIRWFDVRKYLVWLHVVVCLMSVGIAAIGIAEVVTQRDLFLLPESAVIVAGNANESGAQIWLRPNGPFSSTNSYALIGLVSFLLLLFLNGALAGRMGVAHRLLHRVGVSVALLTAFLPLFRSVLTSLILILIIDTLYSRGARRLVRVAALGGFGLAALLMQVVLPQIAADRTDPENVFGRIAEQRQIMTMFLDNPVVGVGFNNFNDAAQKGKYVAYYQGVQSVDYPHNNLGALLVETGLAGLLPFVISQLFLVMVFWKMYRSKKRTPESTMAWKFFLFIFLAYWINGMSLASAYYSDLNLWYMLAIAIIYKYGWSAPVLPGSVNNQSPA